MTGIKVLTTDEAKQVSKPWGWEKWIAHGTPDYPYAYKQIYIRAPYKTSLQFHVFKQESNYLLKGSAILHYADAPVDMERLGLDKHRYERGEYSSEELHTMLAPQLPDILSAIKTRTVNEGETIHVWPGYVHRIEARDTDLLLMEVSTDHLMDVIRLHDDASRPHGHIASEHK